MILEVANAIHTGEFRVGAIKKLKSYKVIKLNNDYLTIEARRDREMSAEG